MAPLTDAQATVAGGLIQGGTSLFGQILGTVIGGIQGRRLENKADEWNNKMLQREDQQNRFSNMATMRQLDQNDQSLKESKRMNTASLYTDQMNQMLSKINNNSNLKNLVLQKWGGK